MKELKELTLLVKQRMDLTKWQGYIHTSPAILFDGTPPHQSLIAPYNILKIILLLSIQNTMS